MTPFRMPGLGRTPKTQRGFSLVEAMIALLVLSVGMVGLAYLQTTGMRFTTSSYQRTQASILAADYLDIVRSYWNSNQAAELAHERDERDAVLESSCIGNTQMTATFAAEAECWLYQLVQAIPSAEVEITQATVSAGQLSEVRIEIRWIENNVRENTNPTPGAGGENYTERTLTTQTRLPLSED